MFGSNGLPLDLAADLNVGNTLVASDCLEVIKGLQASSMSLYSQILQEVGETARLRGGVEFRHEGRRSNEEAHNLARSATSLPNGRHVWLGYRPEGLNIPVNVLSTYE